MVGDVRTVKRAVVTIGLTILLTAGCAHVPASVPGSTPNNGTPQIEKALQDARTEAATLRSHLASARIMTAKQEAELRELRRQVNELQQILDARQTELIVLREERDRLAQAATVAQVRVADPSTLPPSADDVNAMKAKLREMETTLAALAAELAQVKRELTRPTVIGPTR